MAAIPEVRADVPVEEALRIASQRGQPLVLIFHATWCTPCKKLEETTLRDPYVVQRLATAHVERLDLDGADGGAAARRYNVTSVPTIVFVDVDGSELSRLDGVIDDRTLISSIDQAKHRVGSVRDLFDRVAQHPGDIDARLRLANHHAAIGNVEEAIGEYRIVAATHGLHPSKAADATLAADALETRRARLTSTLDAALAFARQFPGDPRTGIAIVQVAYARHVPRAEITALTTAHLQAVSRYYRRQAVHAAIAAEQASAARPFVERWLADEPTRELRLLGAEVDIVDGQRARGLVTIADICQPMPRELARRCYDLRNIDSKVPGAEAVRDAAARVVVDLTAPGSRSGTSGRTRLWALEETVGNEVAAALAAAETECASSARGRDFVYLRLATKLGRTVVDVSGETQSLVDCVRRRMGELPMLGTKQSVGFMLDITHPRARPQREFPTPGEARMLPGPARGRIGGGLAIDFVLRGGEELVTTGLALDGRFAITSLGPAALVGGVTLEASFTDGGEGVHIARGYAGLGTMIVPQLAMTALAGVGVSDFGPLAPNAMELPIELALRADLGKSVRGHTRLRTTFVTGDTMRQTDGVDEVAISVGVNVELRANSWFWIDAAIESRADERNGMLTFGFPLGSFF